MADALIVQATGAPSSGAVAVRIRGATGSVLVPTSFTMPGGGAIAAGSVLLVTKIRNRWWVTQGLYTATLEAAPVVDPPPTVTDSGTTVFAPVETRSIRGTSWRLDRTNVYQGNYQGQGNHVGCAFYGAAPTSLGGATVSAGTVRIRRTSGPGYLGATAGATTLALITESTRPAGAPTVQDTDTGPVLADFGTESVFTLPAGWGQSLVDGTAGALGLYRADGSNYLATDGLAQYAAAWQLSLTWAR